MTETKFPFPIDLVYLWVDGNDPEWRAKRNRYMNIGGDFASQGHVEARWRDNDELKYSLRSVEMYAPWVRRIFIVTDGQCPSWLNRNHPKIQIVDHSEILPSEALPTYNSTAIESCIHRIKDLSEHFLFSNDDTMFGAPVSPETFFTSDGRPIIRMLGVRFNRSKALRRGDNYNMMLYRMQEKINGIFGHMILHAPHHNIDAYRKSDYAYCYDILKHEWEQTTMHRFRHDGDMHRSFMSYYAIASGRGVLRKVKRYNGIRGVSKYVQSWLKGRYASDSRCISVQSPDYDAIFAKYNPLMFCMNDGEGATDNDRERMVAFLSQKFPDKSEFEL